MDLLNIFDFKDEKHVHLLEKVLSDHQNLYTNDTEKLDSTEKFIITTINKGLDHAATHCQALNFLSRFLPTISRENLASNFRHWSSKITEKIKKLANAPSHSEEYQAVCKALAALVINVKPITKLDERDSTSFTIKQIIEIIVGSCSENKNESVLHLLTVLLYYYPELCLKFQTSITKIVASSIDDEEINTVYPSAKCYSLLVRAYEPLFNRNTDKKSILVADNSSANCHILHQIDLCNNLRAIMDELFHDLITEGFEPTQELQYMTYINTLKLSSISSDDLINYYTDIQNRFTNICIYLTMLLKIGGNKDKKFVQPAVILHTVRRGLSITPNILKKNDGDRKDMLSLILPELHTSLLNVLESLITSFRQELLTSALSIQDSILQILDFTKGLSTQSWKNVRIYAYKVLSTWLKYTGSSSGFQIVADKFSEHILKDISLPQKNVLILTAKKSFSKNKQKNDKSKEVQYTNSSNIDINDGTTNHADSSLCLIVLSAVQSIVSSMNFQLAQSFYDDIGKTIVSILYEQYTKKNSVSNFKINTELRLQLLKTLRVLQTYSNTSKPSFIPYTITIFRLAIFEETEQRIIEEANHGLAEIHHIVHPSGSTLMIPLRGVSMDESPCKRPRFTLEEGFPNGRHDVQESLSKQSTSEDNPKILTSNTESLCKKSRLEESNPKTSTSNAESSCKQSTLKENRSEVLSLNAGLSLGENDTQTSTSNARLSCQPPTLGENDSETLTSNAGIPRESSTSEDNNSKTLTSNVGLSSQQSVLEKDNVKTLISNVESSKSRNGECDNVISIDDDDDDDDDDIMMSFCNVVSN